MSDGSTHSNNDIECPWCGHVNRDSYELPDDGEGTCGSCEQPIRWSRCIAVTYTTHKNRS